MSPSILGWMGLLFGPDAPGQERKWRNIPFHKCFIRLALPTMNSKQATFVLMEFPDKRMERASAFDRKRAVASLSALRLVLP